MIENAVNRSLSNILEPYKLLITGGILFLAGLITAFFMAFSSFSNTLMQKSLFLIPLFISIGLLLSLGSFLCKLYLEELKRNKGNLIPTFKTLAMRLLGATYFSIPFLVAFVMLWISIGLFELLTYIPYVGPLFSTIFAFIPFVINLCFFLLIGVGLFSLFILAPLMGTENEIDKGVLNKAISHLLKNPFKNCANFLIGILPAAILSWIGYLALNHCSFCVHNSHPLLALLQNVSLAVPLTILLILPTIFFFQYALESWIMIDQQDGPVS